MSAGASRQDRVFCCGIDSRYLTRALVMWESLRAFVPGAALHVVCFDDEALALLRRLDEPGIVPWSLAELEAWDPELAAVKPIRSRVEYMWTTTPCQALFALERGGAGTATYLDADLMFFSSPEPIYEEMGDAPLLLTPARHPPEHSSREAYGRFNVQFLPVSDDPRSREGFEWWRERCIEHCSTRLDEQGRYGDQKYLESWPELFEGVHVLEHPGGGLAPWNMEAHRIESTRNGNNTAVTVDGLPLIFFHYSLFRRSRRRVQLADARFRLGSEARRGIFKPYAERIDRAGERIAGLDPAFDPFDPEPTPMARFNQTWSAVAGRLSRLRR